MVQPQTPVDHYFFYPNAQVLSTMTHILFIMTNGCYFNSLSFDLGVQWYSCFPQRTDTNKNIILTHCNITSKHTFPTATMQSSIPQLDVIHGERFTIGMLTALFFLT